MYAGKNDLQQKCIESTNEVSFSSSVSDSENTSYGDQTKSPKQTDTEEADATFQQKEIQKEALEEKNKEKILDEEIITNDITKLKVKDEDEKKDEK